MDNILEYPKPTTGKIHLEMALCNFEQLVQEVASEVEMMYLGDKQIRIIISIAPGLDSKTIMDPELIMQVLRQLIGGMVLGAEHGDIHVSLTKERDNLHFAVRGKVDTVELGGCREIITAHRGKIWVDQEPSAVSYHLVIPQVHIEEKIFMDDLFSAFL